MTLRIRLISLVVLALGTGAFAAGPDPSAPRTPQEALGLLKAGNDRFARNASSPVSLSVTGAGSWPTDSTRSQSSSRARTRACRPSSCSTLDSATCSSSAPQAK